MEIEINDLNVGFDNRIVLKNLSAKLKKGGTYIVRGQSGVGKTTFLNVVAGYINKYSGKIVLNKGSRIEYVFQSELLFNNLSILENLYLKKMALKDNKEFVDDLKIDEVIKEVGLNELKNQKIKQLSGGEKQRVQIAKAMLRKPDIIMFDEPTAKLDEVNTKNIILLINKLFEKSTIIIVTHDDIGKYLNDYIELNMIDGRLIQNEK